MDLWNQELYVSVTCKSPYCTIVHSVPQVERTEVNGVLATLVRQCIDTCYYGCRPKGFGIQVETCANCCQTTGCNNFYPTLDIGGAHSEQELVEIARQQDEDRANPDSASSRGLLPTRQLILQLALVAGSMMKQWPWNDVFFYFQSLKYSIVMGSRNTTKWNVV